jgi:hypothetical protein
LIKNAIPSIFPTFNVDLSDPSFAIEDSNDASGSGEVIENGDGNYYYDDNRDDDGYNENGQPHQIGTNKNIPTKIASSNNQNKLYIDENEEDDPRYVTYQSNKSEQRKMISSSAKPLPKLTPATTAYNNSRKSNPATIVNNEYVRDEPPIKKMTMMGGSSGGVVTKTPNNSSLETILNRKPPLTFKGSVVASQNSNSKFPNSFSNSNNGRPSSSLFNNSASKFQNSSSSSSSSKLYQQLCKSMPNTKFPMSWNSDLEIEVIESNSNDSTPVSSLKQRIDELGKNI